jgi:N-acetylmuramoyl-L-alanine amidase
MRRVVLAALAALATAAPAHAADCSFSASKARGPAPLAVSFTATCADGAAVHWSFGDGAVADGLSAAHTFGVGSWRPAADVTAADGTAAHVVLRPVIAYRVTLSAPRRARYGEISTLRARVTPTLAGGITIAGSRARRTGPGAYRVRMRMTRPGPFTASFAGTRSPPVWVRLVPKLEVSLAGAPTVGSAVRVVTRLVPPGAGTVRVRVDGRATNAVDTRRVHTARIVASSTPRKGWAPAAQSLAVSVVEPTLAVGSSGPAVRALEERLRDLHYALRGVDGVYGSDDAEAVLAFQKVSGLGRTGRVDRALWARLAAAEAPRARFGGTHVEVDKTRQVLFMVVNGRVDEVVHVSTGATGNTPVGLWHVYSKVPGWSWVLWYPNYFLRGFAIHGYPEVPAYPASHGCVRVPMWLATSLYARIPYGFSIYVYY